MRDAEIKGFISVKQHSRYDLPPPIEAKGQTLYGISVFHQLHCLVGILWCRSEYHLNESALIMLTLLQDMIEHVWIQNLTAASSSMEAGHENQLRHVDHCFGYLRQALMCCSDTTLEGQAVTSDAKGTDGFGVKHRCRDFASVYRWAQTHNGLKTES